MVGSLLVKTEDGRWETLGVDRFPNVKPEAVSPTWDSWGPDAMSFALKRDPTIQHPDLAPFTPVQWKVDGRLLWDGYTIDRPGGQDGLTVSCIGRQHELDDDVFSRMLVHQDLTEWTDIRGAADSRLSDFVANPTVVNGDGRIVTCWPVSAVAVANTGHGIYMDWGPNPACWPIRVEMTFAYIPGSQAVATQIYMRAVDAVPYSTSVGGGTAANSDTIPGTGVGNITAGELGGNTPTPRRYTTIFVWRATSNLTPTSDYGIIISSIRAFRKANYSNMGIGNATPGSLLKVSDILKQALPIAPTLDQDTSEIASTLLNIAHADWRKEDKTAREIIEEWNTYHRYQVTVKPGGRVRYRPIPSRATLKCSVNTSGGAKWVDGSGQSGRELYNKVVALGQSGAGKPLRVESNTALAIYRQDPLAPIPGFVVEAAALQPTNPSATTDPNPTGWSVPAGLGTLSRDLVVFDTTPASIKLFNGGSPFTMGAVTLTGDFSAGGTFLKGQVYTLTVALRATVTGNLNNFDIRFGDVAGNVDGSVSPSYIATVHLAESNVWQTHTLVWVPTSDVPSQFCQFWLWYTGSDTGGVTALWIDSIVVARAAPTSLDKRKRSRAKILQIGSPTDELAMQALADAFMLVTKTAPLKGSLEVAADTVVTEINTGRPIPVTDLGSKVNELVLLDNLVDPDTGAQGRIGTLAAVNYQDGIAQIVIDNGRDNFEALLARMGIIQRG